MMNIRKNIALFLLLIAGGMAFVSASEAGPKTPVATTGRKHICKTCNKIFTQKSNLTDHMRTHTGERPFACDMCGKAFIQKSNLKEHMITHTGERPHVCHECGEAFSRASYLKRHERIHSGERPFPCTQCGKAFAQSSDLSKHMNRMHKPSKKRTQIDDNDDGSEPDVSDYFEKEVTPSQRTVLKRKCAPKVFKVFDNDDSADDSPAPALEALAHIVVPAMAQAVFSKSAAEAIFEETDLYTNWPEIPALITTRTPQEEYALPPFNLDDRDNCVTPAFDVPSSPDNDGLSAPARDSEDEAANFNIFGDFNTHGFSFDKEGYLSDSE